MKKLRALAVLGIALLSTPAFAGSVAIGESNPSTDCIPVYCDGELGGLVCNASSTGDLVRKAEAICSVEAT
jgi:hypothetical protein